MKTIRDLPHFLVTNVRPGQPRVDEYLSFDLSGTFDKIDGVREGRCWLLLPERDCLICDLESLDAIKRTAVLRTSEPSEPAVLGSSLPYVDGFWQAYHIWMVTEPEWIWEKATFRALDAFGRRFESDEVQIVDGQEVREWVEITKGEQGEKGRYYPVYPGKPLCFDVGGETGLVKGGWDHEHCELCNEHIEPGETGYFDRGDHWVCEKCFVAYVAAHDLSFLD